MYINYIDANDFIANVETAAGLQKLYFTAPVSDRLTTNLREHYMQAVK